MRLVLERVLDLEWVTVTLLELLLQLPMDELLGL
jgi:hypothetical protein